jgi:hypothetical protein
MSDTKISRHTFMPQMRFEPTIPVLENAVYVLDRAVSVSGHVSPLITENFLREYLLSWAQTTATNRIYGGIYSIHFHLIVIT